MPVQKAFLLSLVALVTIGPLESRGQPQAPALLGAWRIVRTSLTTSDQPSLVDCGQPGLLLFTAGHYSLMYVEGNKTRQYHHADRDLQIAKPDGDGASEYLRAVRVPVSR